MLRNRSLWLVALATTAMLIGTMTTTQASAESAPPQIVSVATGCTGAASFYGLWPEGSHYTSALLFDEFGDPVGDPVPGFVFLGGSSYPACVDLTLSGPVPSPDYSVVLYRHPEGFVGAGDEAEVAAFPCDDGAGGIRASCSGVRANINDSWGLLGNVGFTHVEVVPSPRSIPPLSPLPGSPFLVESERITEVEAMRIQVAMADGDLVDAILARNPERTKEAVDRLRARIADAGAAIQVYEDQEREMSTRLAELDRLLAMIDAIGATGMRDPILDERDRQMDEIEAVQNIIEAWKGLRDETRDRLRNAAEIAKNSTATPPRPTEGPVCEPCIELWKAVIAKTAALEGLIEKRVSTSAEIETVETRIDAVQAELARVTTELSGLEGIGGHGWDPATNRTVSSYYGADGQVVVSIREGRGTDGRLLEPQRKYEGKRGKKLRAEALALERELGELRIRRIDLGLDLLQIELEILKCSLELEALEVALRACLLRCLQSAFNPITLGLNGGQPEAGATTPVAPSTPGTTTTVTPPSTSPIPLTRPFNPLSLGLNLGGGATTAPVASPDTVSLPTRLSPVGTPTTTLGIPVP